VKRVLGIGVSGDSVRAVLVERDRIAWAGLASYSGEADLAEVVGRLAAEAGVPVRRARVVFERDVVQLRTIVPAPPLRGEALRRYVVLETPRLFRKNDHRLVVDGVAIDAGSGAPALWAGAIAETLVESALDGCSQAGLAVEAVGPAADVLPCALAAPPAQGDVAFLNGGTTEILSLGPSGAWRSRRVGGAEARGAVWSPALVRTGAEASHFAAAYAAAVARPKLDFSPPRLGVARRRTAARHRVRLAIVGVGLWLLAGSTYALRLAAESAEVRRELARSAPSVETALALRRDLDAATATLATIATAERARSHQVALLAGLTAALGDSAYLVALQSGADGTVRLVGYAPAATRVLAELERVPGLGSRKLEGPVSREAPAGGAEMDRFSIVAQRIRAP